MQLQDVVKLLYQSEFGGGHMITSPEKSLDRLKEEYKSFKWEYSPIICEPIGGEMYRIYLSALEDGLSRRNFKPDALQKLQPEHPEQGRALRRN